MFASQDYELLDFGEGRKLERFGPYVLDRPSPPAEGSTRRSLELWRQATARFERTASGSAGRWSVQAEIVQPWTVRFGQLAFELKLSDAGQVGVFPEQADNWQWIARQAQSSGSLTILNLFAYTGGSTLAAAAAGASVVHVDAAAGVVARARRNAATSRLEHLPIRWMTEDVLRFVGRERRRGNRYDAVILDPPAYGRGPRGQRWKLEDHLDELLNSCWDLCRGKAQFLLLTCHSGRLGRPAELREHVAARQPDLCAAGSLASGEMSLVSSTGGRLHCGAAVRWTRGAA